MTPLVERITVDRWMPFLEQKFPGGAGTEGITPFQILHAVVLVYDLMEGDLFRSSAAEPISTARALAMTLIANQYDLDNGEMAHLFACNRPDVGAAKARISGLYIANRWDRERFERVCDHVRLPHQLLTAPRPMQGHPAPGRQPAVNRESVRVQLTNLDPLDAQLVRTMISALTDPALADTRSKLRTGAIALSADGSEPTWVSPSE